MVTIHPEDEKYSKEQQDFLYELILNADRKAAIELLEKAMSNIGYQKTLSLIIEPTLKKVGDRFVLDKLSLAQGYIAGRIVEDFLGLLSAEIKNAGNEPEHPHTKIAVIGNIEDDYHSIGRRMVATLLRMDGWLVKDLGNDVLAKAFVDEALRMEASVIGVSAMMLTNAQNIRKVRKEIDNRKLENKIKLAVGGAIFVMRPELADEVGGDGTAINAIECPMLFNRLLAKVRTK